MTRVVRLLLAYDGTGFRGWAAQRDLSIRTVEGELSSVLGRIVNEPIKLSVAGRTDAGVHARGQVTSFTTTTNLAPDRIRDARERHPRPRARRPAGLGRARRVRRAFLRNRPGVSRTRSRPAMSPIRSRRGTPGIVPAGCTCPRCVGRGSCSSANATSPRSAATRDEDDRRSAHLQRVAVRRAGDQLTIAFRANAFLHQMVRSLVGTLVAVGTGRLEPDAVDRILAARDRAAAPQIAPPHGLTLERVIYGRPVRETTGG